MEFFEGEKEREAASKTVHPVSDASISVNVLQDPLDKLAAVCSVCEPTVDDLVNALCVTSEDF